ncbi:MAG TPA: 16S rRNA (cytidine(1402)-2'-O)-methyltransferase [Saprospiraceae bacterium]|nr:16S rRNA (cytidine(1402)-2'-O)-methyltransferase [Saprospiraceae bacterium]
MLYLVPTPLGNLQDMTFRAIEILRSVDYIYCEDTRTSGQLLKHFEIKNNLRSFHAHNEHLQVNQLIEALQSGQSVALITDAGTPAISDPGFLAVRACVEHDIKVSCLPGATAFVPALAASGLPSDRFYFEGFLPHKKGKQTRIKYLAQLDCTIVLYESPHRLIKTLDQMAEFFGDSRKACVAREISKMYEEYSRGTLRELVDEYTSRPNVKGEIVLVVGGNS